MFSTLLSDIEASIATEGATHTATFTGTALRGATVGPVISCITIRSALACVTSAIGPTGAALTTRPRKSAVCPKSAREAFRVINVSGNERHCDTEPEIAEAGATGAHGSTDRDVDAFHHIGEFANTLFLCRTAGTGVTSVAAGIVIILITVIAVLFLILYPIATGNTRTFF